MTENKENTPVLGILSTIFGGLSMVPLLGIISPIGLILGIVGLCKETKKTMSIIGTCISALGILTSPILWGIVGCTLDVDSCKVEKTTNFSLNENITNSKKLLPEAIEDL